MANPYATSAAAPPLVTRRYQTGLLMMLSIVAAACGFMAGLPAAVLLNQEYGVVPIGGHVHDIQFNGEPISNQTVIQRSLMLAGPLLFAALICGVMAVRRWRLNKRQNDLLRNPDDHEGRTSIESDGKITERELASKFVQTWHLSVPERKAMPTGSLASSLIVSEICARLEDESWYPTDWRTDDGFNGGLIEQLDAGRCRIIWKVECGVSRFGLQEVEEFDSLAAAARRYALRFFGKSFDGIPIDWKR